MNLAAQYKRWRRWMAWVALPLCAAVLLFIARGDSVYAAIELAYFRATATTTSVQLEWATVAERNLDGFEILCKRADEPDTKYHAIGSRIAQGGPDRGATYTFNVTSGMTPGHAYCFRIVEKTTDGFPGEKFDLCGYGPGVTPAAPVAYTASGDATPTPIPLEQPPGADPAPTLQPTSPIATPAGQMDSPLALPTPTPDQPESPLPDGASVQQAGSDAQETPTPWPTEEPTEEPTPTESPTPTATDWPTPTATEWPTATDWPTPTQTPTEDPASVAVVGTPTPLYIVVTATPTPQSAALIAPVYTPWPTATPEPVQTFADLLVPTTQNLMVMLLCLIFLSASGLGVLGLVTSILYMRSQTRRERYLPPPYGRRRY